MKPPPPEAPETAKTRATEAIHLEPCSPRSTPNAQEEQRQSRGEIRERPENQNAPHSLVKTESEGNSLSQGKNGLSTAGDQATGVKSNHTGLFDQLVTGPHARCAHTPPPLALEALPCDWGSVLPSQRPKQRHPGHRFARCEEAGPGFRWRCSDASSSVTCAGPAPSWHKTWYSHPAWRKQSSPNPLNPQHSPPMASFPCPSPDSHISSHRQCPRMHGAGGIECDPQPTSLEQPAAWPRDDQRGHEGDPERQDTVERWTHHQASRWDSEVRFLDPHRAPVRCLLILLGSSR